MDALLLGENYARGVGISVNKTRIWVIISTALVAGTRERILADAKAIEEAGAFAIVIEGVPKDLAAEITETLSIPTIGIAAGKIRE